MFWMGTTGNDRKIGTAENDIFHAMEGNDYLTGGGGNDILSGMLGDDTIFGGSGDDFIGLWQGDRAKGGTGADIFSVVGGPFPFDVEGSIRAVVSDFNAAQGDTVQVTNFTFDWADRDRDFTDGFAIVQRGAHLLLRTRDGDDNVQEVLFLNTRRGALTESNVTLIPALFGAQPGARGAAVLPSDGAEPVVAARPGLEWFGTDADETRTGTGRDDMLVGGGGRDKLFGLTGADVLNGQSGADFLKGGLGADRIYVAGLDRAMGDGGSDTFVLLSPEDFPAIADAGRAVIRDFAPGEMLEILGFDASFADGDLGLEDGFQLRETRQGVMVTLIDAEDTRLDVLLRGVDLADLSPENFTFL